MVHFLLQLAFHSRLILLFPGAAALDLESSRTPFRWSLDKYISAIPSNGESAIHPISRREPVFCLPRLGCGVFGGSLSPAEAFLEVDLVTSLQSHRPRCARDRVWYLRLPLCRSFGTSSPSSSFSSIAVMSQLYSVILLFESASAQKIEAW